LFFFENQDGENGSEIFQFKRKIIEEVTTAGRSEDFVVGKDFYSPNFFKFRGKINVLSNIYFRRKSTTNEVSFFKKSHIAARKGFEKREGEVSSKLNKMSKRSGREEFYMTPDPDYLRMGEGVSNFF